MVSLTVGGVLDKSGGDSCKVMVPFAFDVPLLECMMFVDASALTAIIVLSRLALLTLELVIDEVSNTCPAGGLRWLTAAEPADCDESSPDAPSDGECTKLRVTESDGGGVIATGSALYPSPSADEESSGISIVCELSLAASPDNSNDAR